MIETLTRPLVFHGGQKRRRQTTCAECPAMLFKSHFAHYRARPKICFYWLSSQQFWLHISLSLFLRTMEPISVPYVFKTTLTQQMCREKRLKLPIFKGILVSQKCLTVLRGYLCSQGSLYPQSFVMVLTPTHHRFDTWGMEPMALEKISYCRGQIHIWRSS